MRHLRPRAFTSILVAAVMAFLCAIVLGIKWGFANNELCLPMLGCAAGFSGYDAMNHFFAGLGGALAIIWLTNRFPRLRILDDGFIKNALVVVSFVALGGICWELLEFSHDQALLYGPTWLYRFDVALSALLHLTPHLQPTNADTMGDLVFDVLGGVVASLVAWLLSRKSITQDTQE